MYERPHHSLSLSRQLISSSSHETYCKLGDQRLQGAMAVDSCYDCCVLPPLPGWDCAWTPSSDDDDDDDGGGGFFAAMLGVVESPVSSEASSGGGYLEDAAVFHWSDRCKRQRPQPPPPPRRPAMVNEDLQCLVQKQSLWDSVSVGEGDILHDSEMMIRETSSFVISEEDASGREQEQAAAGSAQRSAAQGEAGPPPPPRLLPATGQLHLHGGAAPPPLLQLQKATRCEPPRRRSSIYGEDQPPSSSSSLAGKENAGYGVLWPFQFIKPMGLEGGGMAALKEVNRRILKRPARPVRHPVGRFACSAAVSSAGGVGLSGKAVVSITRIRTGGKGTITIVRTRG